MQLFFVDTNADGRVYLSPEEAHHCLRVLRHKVGDIINATDGKGRFLKVQLVNNNEKNLEVNILEETYFEALPYYLHIAIAPTKNADRLEWFVEKAVEIGVSEISIIHTERTERKHVNIERLYKVVQSAAKQSMKMHWTKINELKPFKKFISEFANDNSVTKTVAHLIDGEERISLAKILKASKSNLVLIGPEGDFTPSEVELALTSGFKPVSLGEARLRTETAGVMVAALASTVAEL